MSDQFGAHRPIKDLDWNLLRVFVVVAEEGGITRAANKLLRTQPTVSSALKRLEESIGRQLIVRGGGRFELTDHGTILYREASRISDSLRHLDTMLHEADDDVTGSIRIAMASYVVFPPFDAILGSFHDLYPKVTFTLDVMPSKQVIATTSDGLCSLGICLLAKPQKHLTTHVLYREKFGFFCGTNHPLYGRTDVRLKELQDSTYVALKTDQIADALHPIAKIRQKYGLGGEPTGTSSHVEEIRRMIVAGLGIGSLPVHAMERDMRDGRLWRIPLTIEEPTLDVHIAINERAMKDRGERAFIARLVDYIESTDIADRSLPYGE